MIVAGVAALMSGAAVLILFAGYCYGRWETEAHFEPIIDELEETIDGLLPSGLTVRT